MKSKEVERIIGPTGPIIVEFLGEPTPEAYQFLEDYIKLRKGVLKSLGAAGAKPQLPVSEPEGKEEKQALQGVVRRNVG